MIADVWSVVAGAAKTGNALLSKYIIEPRNTCNVDFCTVENRFSTCDRQAILIEAARSGKVGPSLKKVKDVWAKLRVCRISSRRIIDADVETGKLCLQ